MRRRPSPLDHPLRAMAPGLPGAETDSIDTGATMQPQAHTPAEDASRRFRANLLCVTPRRLGSWAAAGNALDRVIVPKGDEEAWEGTEIDVLRTVL